MTGATSKIAVLENRLLQFFSAESGVVAAYLFGSHAHQRAHRESDVDLAVLLDHEAFPDPKARFAARLRLSASLIGVLHENEIDLVVLNDVPPGLARAVVLDGRRLHCSDPAAEHAFRRGVQLRAADVAPFLERARRTKLEALAR